MKKLVVWGTLVVLVLVFLATSVLAECETEKKVMSAAERQELVGQAEALRAQFTDSAGKLRVVLFEAALINAEMFEGGKINQNFFENQNQMLCRLYDTTNWQSGEVEGQDFNSFSPRDLRLWITKLQVDIAGLKKAVAAIKKGRVFREEAFFPLIEAKR